MKKINYLAMSFLAAAFGFASCDDKNDCGCDCNQPIIDRIELTDGGIDSISGNKINLIDSTVSGGQTIAVFGENLGGIKSISFVGDASGKKKNVVLKPAFITDNTIVYTVPDLDEDCHAVYYTAACPDGFALAPIAKVAPPKVTMVFNEFVNDKDTLKMKGTGFIGDVKVSFFKDAEYKEEIEALSVNVIDKNEIHAVLPEGVAEGSPIKIKTIAGEQISEIRLRDRRNVLIDFDNNIDYTYNKGSENKQEAILNCKVSSYKGGDYGVFDGADWQMVSYQPEANNGLPAPEYSTVFGPFEKDLEAGTYGPCDFTVKFEIFVSNAKPLKGEAYTIGFTAQDDGTADNLRNFCAFFIPSEVDWNKEGEAWKVNDIKDYYTNGWMTVSLPMSEFLWNAATNNAYTSPHDGCATVADAWGSPDKLPYCAAFPEIANYNYGGLSILWCSYDSPHTNKGIMAIDNVRIVPDDGNGAYYSKIKYGVPERHYYDAPILK